MHDFGVLGFPPYFPLFPPIIPRGMGPAAGWPKAYYPSTLMLLTSACRLPVSVCHAIWVKHEAHTLLEYSADAVNSGDRRGHSQLIQFLLNEFSCH